MTTTITIRKPEDVDPLIRQVLHFAPEDSLVVVPLGDGDAPWARVDLDSQAALREAFSDAIGAHWGTILVVTYADQAPSLDYADIFPGARIAAVVNRPNPEADTFREKDLAALTEHATTVAEAETAAWAAYEAGDGALAYRYLDRAETLGGITAGGRDLTWLLEHAVAPGN